MHPQGARHFYPRPPRGGRHAGDDRKCRRQWISTHALREEGDDTSISALSTDELISTHALREEGDRGGDTVADGVMTFLPTPSARRATSLAESVQRMCKISTHALREEGDVINSYNSESVGISTHALREEGDPSV